MISIPHSKGKKFYVFGLGKSGLSAAQALIRSGAHVVAFDDRESTIKQAQSLGIQTLSMEQVDWDQQTALILSPGIPHTFPKPHPVVEYAKRHHVPIWCDVELLFQSHPDQIFLGITGSNGKSTTTALIAHILRHAGHEVQEGGNIGIPALDLKPLQKKGVYVIELSSFQLDLCFTPVLDIAVLMNITKNHLERHGGMDGYIKSKRHIFDLMKPTGKKVIGVDSLLMKSMETEEKGIPISVQDPLKKGVFVDHGMLKDSLFSEGEIKIIFDLSTLENLKGSHNFQNIAAAYATVSALNLGTTDQIVEAIRSFQGLPHRQEIVAKMNNTLWVNDSKATTLEASTKSIQQFNHIYWIMGGVEKEGYEDISALLPYANRIKKIFLMGRSAPLYHKLFAKQFDCVQVKSLDQAVSLAYTCAQQHLKEQITVLLAPACASYDQFKNFEERGDVFKKLVHQIK